MSYIEILYFNTLILLLNFFFKLIHFTFDFRSQLMRLNLTIMTALLPINLVFAGDNPVLQDDFLKVPHIDTPEQVGQYQDAMFKRNGDDTWAFLGMTETRLAAVEKVEVIKISSRPVQIFLKVSGYLPNACYEVEQAGQRFEQLFNIGEPGVEYPAGQFDVALGLVPLQTFAACAEVIEPFERTIPLPVYGLSHGDYLFDVNGIAGSFRLDKDNNLPKAYGLKAIPIPKLDNIIPSKIQ